MTSSDGASGRAPRYRVVDLAPTTADQGPVVTHAAFDGERELATAAVRADPESRVLELLTLTARPDAYPTGLAGALVHDVVARAAQAGMRAVRCIAPITDPMLLALLAEHGFEPLVDDGTPDPSAPAASRPVSGPRAVERSLDGRRVLREIGPAEAAAVMAVQHAAFAEYADRGAPSGALLETPETLTAALAGGARAVLAEVDGTPVAGAKLVLDADRRAEFSRLSVLPGARGHGHAAALVDRLRHMAVDAGALSFGCTVRAAETGNIALYEHLGMREDGRGSRRSLTGADLAVVHLSESLSAPTRDPGAATGTASSSAR